MTVWNQLTDSMIPVVGWAGAALFLVAYLAVSQGRLHPNSHLYQGLNIAGALGLGICNTSHSAFPSATLNLLWIGIGIHTVMTRCARD